MGIGTDTPETTSVESRATYRKRIKNIPGMNPDQFKIEEQRFADAGKKSKAQLFQDKLLDLDTLLTEHNRGEENMRVMRRKSYDAEKAVIANLIRAVGQETIKKSMPNTTHNNLEVGANKHGLSFLTPDGFFTEEDEQPTEPIDLGKTQPTSITEVHQE